MADKRRRRRGSGSVYQDKHGQWWAKVALGNGKTRRARAASRKAAEAEVKRLTGELAAGIDVVASQQTVKAWLEYWLTVKAPADWPCSLSDCCRDRQGYGHSYGHTCAILPPGTSERPLLVAASARPHRWSQHQAQRG